jgi:hypothetical protein
MKILAFIAHIRRGILRFNTARGQLSETEREEERERRHAEREDLDTERGGDVGEGDEQREERHERQMEAESYEDQENVTLRWPEELLIQTLSCLDVTSILRCRRVRSPLLLNLPCLIPRS